ncbi:MULTISPECIES: DUF6710 family protein [Stenotrophomonas]|uniref:DUF6710 family protein n=1 Tax=Stenotrophomonas TaxID=40323 RepID=UPI0018D437DE|nr:DUF6710 family protein [Stenotrophomonas sp.]MBH1507032.1 hypothetical protein [Stenotrophomonas maltophilia]
MDDPESMAWPLKPRSTLSHWAQCIGAPLLRAAERAKARSERRARARPEARFQRLMETAHEIAAINPAGLPDFISAILRPLQAEHLLSIAEFGGTPDIEADSWTFFGPAVRRRLFADDGSTWRPTTHDPDQHPMALARDLVLPWPWNHGRYVSALATIGSTKGHAQSPAWLQRWQGPWRQDPLNHSVELWLPWRIGFVHGGNHSIAAGILAGEGVITPSSVYDFSYLFAELRAEAKGFRRVDNGRWEAAVDDPRIAAVFEIGRLIYLAGQAATPAGRCDSA